MSRVPVLDIRPQVEGGRFPVKSVVGEPVEIWARVFAEGRTVVRAAVILTGPDGTDRTPVPMHHVDNDHWSATIVADEIGPWTFRVASWHDPLATWAADARARVEADVDVELTLTEGALLLRDAGPIEPAALEISVDLVDESIAPVDRLAEAIALIESLPLGAVRVHADESAPLPLFADRQRALVGAWYEMFPRSEGAVVGADGALRSGTFRTAAKRLPAIAAMGFDVVYLPPIHPIGLTGRKGPNNSLTAGPDDVGSPWAIGSPDGGHDAIHPALGTEDDFVAFVARADELGLEIALDLALQCSPDHPWVVDHPEWFSHRADGTIAYAENPPKKYQDIYPLDFDTDPEGLYLEVRRVLQKWIDLGVRIFRVDNPHTKPVVFWERLLTDVRASNPDVLFLAEAFTVPAMLHALAAIGFHQSYTYFTWRVHAGETADYLDEVANRTSHFLRPNFWVNTPDILPTYLHDGNEAMFRMRAVLAATGSPSWGMYAGYEILEHEPLHEGSEEYLDSEKYEIAARDWNSPRSIVGFITRLNELRRHHPALQRLRGLQVHGTSHPDVIAYSRRADDDLVLVVVDLAPGAIKVVSIDVSAAELGLTDPWLVDTLGSSTHRIDAVRLTPQTPARILTHP